MRNKRNQCQYPFAWKQNKGELLLVSHQGETEKSEMKRMRNEGKQAKLS